MCRSIESAILGIIHSIVYFIIINKYSSYDSYYRYIPFILNLGLVQLGNLILWLQSKSIGSGLIENEINHLTTSLIILVLYLQPFSIYYMVSDSLKNNRSLNKIIFTILLVVLISKLKSFLRKENKKNLYSYIKDSKTIVWGKNIDKKKDATNKYLFLLIDILPIVFAYFSTNNLEDKDFFIKFLAITAISFILVVKYSVWWGSEWCAYGNILTGYIAYYLIGKK